jgi:hypothetical protein
MRIPVPDIDPQVRLVYKTRQAIAALQISSRTWSTYIKRLGLKGARKNGSIAKWYTYDQVIAVWEAMVREHILKVRDRPDRLAYKKTHEDGL